MYGSCCGKWVTQKLNISNSGHKGNNCALSSCLHLPRKQCLGSTIEDAYLGSAWLPTQNESFIWLLGWTVFLSAKAM